MLRCKPGLILGAALSAAFATSAAEPVKISHYVTIPTVAGTAAGIKAAEASRVTAVFDWHPEYLSSRCPASPADRL